MKNTRQQPLEESPKKTLDSTKAANPKKQANKKSTVNLENFSKKYAVHRGKSTMLAAALSILLSSCTSVPPTNVHQPMSVRPNPQNTALAGDGSIYQARTMRPLFEDRRARIVGDTLTVLLTETTSASASASNSLERASKASQNVSAMGRIPLKNFDYFNSGYESNTEFDSSGAASNNNRFSGSITVTVIDVYPNGNLLVSGEKQIAIGRETQFVRLSGVVNPTFLSINNQINSTQVADARIEYKGNGPIDEASVMGWLARFFLNVMPF